MNYLTKKGANKLWILLVILLLAGLSQKCFRAAPDVSQTGAHPKDKSVGLFNFAQIKISWL